jgi:5-methylcytosine-specific restriction endonuclease McrA
MNTPRVRRALLRKSKGDLRCPICKSLMKVGEGVDYKTDLEAASIDHFWPKSWGGVNSLCNLRLVHRRCNLLKADTVSLGGGFYVVASEDAT